MGGLVEGAEAPGQEPRQERDLGDALALLAALLAALREGGVEVGESAALHQVREGRLVGGVAVEERPHRDGVA